MAEDGLCVDVFFSERKRLSGTVNGEQLEISAELPVSDGAAAGVFGEEDVSARWQIGSNYGVETTEARFDGDCGGVPIQLVGTFVLGTCASFKSASVTGAIGSQSVTLTITARHDASHTGSINVDGTIGSDAVTFSATSGRRESSVRGVVGEHTIEMMSLRRTARGPDWLRQISARGHLSTEVALLITGCLLYFQPS